MNAYFFSRNIPLFPSMEKSLIKPSFLTVLTRDQVIQKGDNINVVSEAK